MFSASPLLLSSLPRSTAITYNFFFFLRILLAHSKFKPQLHIHTHLSRCKCGVKLKETSLCTTIITPALPRPPPHPSLPPIFFPPSLLCFYLGCSFVPFFFPVFLLSAQVRASICMLLDPGKILFHVLSIACLEYMIEDRSNAITYH